jgi:Sulfotransferase domain
MMAERGDFTVVHEPFSYLAEFGYTDVGGTRVTSAPELIDALRSLAARKPVFAKETTGKRYPEVLAHPHFLARDALHTFLIRHPRETIASYRTLNPDAPLHKIGFESQYEIFAEVKRRTRRVPVVVDADDLMRVPARIVAAYCERVGIEFRPQALAWQPADRHEWELSRRWHVDVASSTGIGDVAAKQAVDVAHDPVLSRYLSYHLPYYQMLRARRLSI